MQQEFIIPYIITNVVAVVLLAMAWKFPRLARLMFAVLFIGAAFFNGSNAASNPAAYLDYAGTALLAFYRNFILGYFAQHTTLLLSIIALCQLFTGIALLLKGRVLRLGIIGGILFFIAIAPLGFGSAFPSTLIMAAGLGLLFRNKAQDYIWKKPGYMAKKEQYILFI